MADFAKVAREVFKILNSFNYTVLLYDDQSMSVQNVEDARRFLSTDHNLMVSIVDDDDKSRINLYYGQSTHASEIEGLIEQLRIAATHYAMSFQAQQHEKEITPKDASSLASISERKQFKMITPLTEGMYGTSRSSYLRMPHAKMIVRHTDKINDSLIGARGRMVEKIFIENAAGERLLFPSTQIAPARAMTQHVNQGGTFADQVGDQIMRMTSDYANLGQASSFVANNAASLQEGAMAVREACRSNMRGLRKTFERLSRPSSYIKESAKIIEQANMLAECGEEEIDETRLSEIRQLLNDADLPRSVYECACRAMDKLKEETPITEEDPAPEAEEPEEEPADDYVPPATTVGVLGNRVDRAAWEAFKAGDLELKSKPYFGKGKERLDPKFPEGPRGTYARLCFNLGGLIPAVKNDSLAGLLQYVLNGIENQTEGVATSLVGEKPKSTRFADMVKVAAHALRLAHEKLTPKLADQNDRVREYIDWLNQFDPDKVLIEGLYSNNPAHPDYGVDYETVVDNALGEVVDDFDPQHFVESPETQDIISGRNPSDPDENTLTRDEVLSALKSYITSYIEMHNGSGAFDKGFNHEVDDTAEHLYDRACEALQGEGWVVDNKHNDEALDEFAMDSDDDDILTIDDIMLPNGNQGDSLVKQVSKQMVKDPDTKGMKKPDSSYINRLQALGWMTTGPNGQAY